MALNAIKAGTPFSVEASKMSMDPGSARDSGYLPAGPKGRFVPQFDSVAWALAPGAMSGLVDTPFGVHIIRRPPLAEVRDRFDAYLKQSQVAAIDSLYMDSLALHKDLKIEKTAPLLIKTAMADPDKSSTSQKALATYTGGALSVQEFLRWVRVLPPQVTGQLKTAPDSMLTRFVKILATNVLLVNEADSAGIKPSAEEWADMVHQYTVQIDSTKAALDLGAAHRFLRLAGGATQGGRAQGRCIHGPDPDRREALRAGSAVAGNGTAQGCAGTDQRRWRCASTGNRPCATGGEGHDAQA